MAIGLTCPNCQVHLATPESLAGKKVRCKRCQGILEVPPAADVNPFRFVADAPNLAVADKPPLEVSVRASRRLPAETASPSRKRRKKKRDQGRPFPWKWILAGGGTVA